MKKFLCLCGAEWINANCTRCEACGRIRHPLSIGLQLGYQQALDDHDITDGPNGRRHQMTVTGCANCAEMDDENVTLRDEMRDMEADKDKEIDELQSSLSEIKGAVDWIKDYIKDIERELL